MSGHALGNLAQAKLSLGEERPTFPTFIRDKQLDSSDRLLIASAEAWLREHAASAPDADLLRALAIREGTDFAAAVAWTFAARIAEGDPWLRQLHCAAPGGRPAHIAPDTLVAIVPGALYREHAYTGAGGERLRTASAELGLPCETVPVISFGTLNQNAEIVLEWLRHHAGRRIILCSLSKGSADIKAALALPGAADAFRNVAVWLSLSGIFFGTPLVGWLRQPFRMLAVRLICRWYGHSTSAFYELDRAQGGPLDRELVLPPHLPLINMMAFPLRRYLTDKLARRTHRRLASQGPSDGGGILLCDAFRVPGHLLPIWGADHYLRSGFDERAWLQKLAQVRRPVFSAGVPVLRQ